MRSLQYREIKISKLEIFIFHNFFEIWLAFLNKILGIYRSTDASENR